MLYVICGPTGCGKTSLAIKLARKLNCIIVNADAFQVYKDMNIGTAKVDNKDEFDMHRLIDVVSPENTFSIKEYRDMFWNVIDEAKGDAIICGGSGLYIRSSLYDYNFPEINDDTSDLEKLSNEELFDMLIKLDKRAAEATHANNRKRVIHAISMARSGNSKSDIADGQKHELIRSDVRFIFINPDREQLYEKINARVETMFSKGLVDEVKGLLNRYNLSVTAREAIGYKETIEYLDGKLSLEECKNLIKQRTRNYAKRQVTYFKHQLPCEIYGSVEEAEKELL